MTIMDRAPIESTECRRGAVVFVIEDDSALREALGTLFDSVGLRSSLFSSASEFRAGKQVESPNCLVLDVRLPGQGGLELLNQLVETDPQIPVVMISGHGDIPMAVRAMKAGAVEFLSKPFRDQEVLDAVSVAIERNRLWCEESRKVADIKARYGSLTPREREVMGLVTAGLMNKQVAARIDSSETTVKAHRSHIMKKMGAKSLAELVRQAELAKSDLPSNRIK